MRVVYSSIMRYLPAQAKEAIGISEETFRHWRRALPPLRGKRGYGPCFTPGDLLALKVVAKLHAFGIQVRHLTPHAEGLFQICSQGAWFALDDKAVIFDGESIELVSVLDSRKLAMRTCMVVPLRSLIAELRQSLFVEEKLPIQSDIVFPPVSVPGGRSA
ncbi:hypothetical protein WT71_25220 [Burkholderia stagnalis]|nr:hypothetical protein WT71_25220 [Burkholderia stagnalis]KWI81138.1 hypothetical protein WT73_27865 [Burkholderia stagnalis]